MNVLIIAGIFPPDIGGPADFTDRFASWLALRGHTVEVVCWSDRTLEASDAARTFSVTRVRRGANRALRLMETLRAIERVGRQSDVWFANGLPLSAWFAANRLSKPVVQKIVGDEAWEVAVRHGWFSGTIDEYQTTTKSARLRLLDFRRSFPVTRVSRVIVPSLYLSRMVECWGVPRERIQIVHNSTRSIEPASFALPDFEGATLLTVCRLVPWKGVDGLIDAVAHLPAVRLVVAGDGPSRAKLELYAVERGVADRVLFLGSISRAHVSAVLRQVSLFILNSSYEGLPHVVLEAMAASLPVIATDVGGTAEAVQHDRTGKLYRYGDQAALLAALRAVLDDPALAASMGREGALVQRQHFSEEACFEQILDILERTFTV